LRTGGFKDAAYRGGDFGTNAFSGDQCYFVCHGSIVL
jgi:hypothetical protein